MQAQARKLKYHVAMTLDGFIAREDDSTDFFPHLSPPDHVMDYLDNLASAYDTVVMGRSTYEFGLKAGVTDPYPSMDTYVCSRSMKDSPNPRVRLIRDDVVGFVLVSGLALLTSGCTAASGIPVQSRYDFTQAECNQTDSTESCCLKQNPGQYERCATKPPAEPLNPYPPPGGVEIDTTPIPDLPTKEERDTWEKDICLPHYEKCRSGKHDGRVWGESHCKACFSACMRYGYWPLRANGKLCPGA